MGDFPTRAFDPTSERLQPIQSSRTEYDFRAVLSEHDCSGLPNAATRAGDNDDFVFITSNSISIFLVTIVSSRVALIFIGLRCVADATYSNHFGFPRRCAELRGFAAKIPQTVETTVKSDSLVQKYREYCILPV